MLNLQMPLGSKLQMILRSECSWELSSLGKKITTTAGSPVSEILLMLSGLVTVYPYKNFSDYSLDYEHL